MRSVNIISILSGCLTLYMFGMNTGGPVVMSIGWPLVGIMVIIVGLAMAEIASSYPTAGGLYYWSARLAGKNAPAWSWFTGWFNLLGQVGITAGIDLGLAFFVTATNSHMIYAFSRDGALPGSSFWHRVNKRTRTPTNSIWLAAVGALILGLPYLWNPTAYYAVTSIATIGLYIAYATPVLLRLRAGERFARGRWHLGRWTKPIDIIAVLWVAFISILFVLPQVYPITALNFNYAIVAVGVVVLFSGG